VTIQGAFHKVQWWHVLLGAAVAVVAVRVFTPGTTSAPLGDEDIQLRVRATGVPSDYAHYAETEWTGRRHPWPGAIGEQISSLIYCGPPDFADRNR